MGQLQENEPSAIAEPVTNLENAGRVCVTLNASQLWDAPRRKGFGLRG